MISPTSAAETLSGKCIRLAGFAEGDIKEDQALTPQDCPRCKTRNSWDGVSCSACPGRSPSLTSTTHPPPQEKFYGIRWRHNTAILVMEFTIEPQDLLITPTRSRSDDRYTLARTGGVSCPSRQQIPAPLLPSLQDLVSDHPPHSRIPHRAISLLS
jgi:hypothetical protein